MISPHFVSPVGVCSHVFGALYSPAIRSGSEVAYIHRLSTTLVSPSHVCVKLPAGG